jgi:hypothetical protein
VAAAPKPKADAFPKQIKASDGFEIGASLAITVKTNSPCRNVAECAPQRRSIFAVL